MSLHPQVIGPIPEETARVARAAFPKGNLYMRMRDEVGTLFTDGRFAALFPTRGQPAEAPWRLVLVTIMQYVENLSDRQAADAVRSRIDWKYVLGLELTDPGFDRSVLSEFRTRLVKGAMEQQLLDALLERCRELKLLKAQGRQRTDSTHVLGAVRGLNRLECVGEAMRYALNSLAVTDPEWLRTHSQPEWVERYGTRLDDYRLPKSEAERVGYAEMIGRDGQQLLDNIYAKGTPEWLRKIPAVEALRRIWVQQYYQTESALKWRTTEEGRPPSALLINSPYDVETRYAQKRSTTWIGYKVHLTETCEANEPHLITHVETTRATTVDSAAVHPIHQALAEKNLLPSRHLVDAGYVDSEHLVRSHQEYGVALFGPAPVDGKWQARAAQGFEVSRFIIDWEKQQATCPLGKTSAHWTPGRDGHGKDVIQIKFSTTDCEPCPRRVDCTRTRIAQRILTIRPKEQYLALQAARARQTTAEYTAEYAKRAGSEGTISQGIRGFGLRRARYIGIAKTHLQHVLIAAAMNFARIAEWLGGRPHAKTRVSAFVAIMAQPATG